MAYCHQNLVAHRDLKFENILLNRGRHVKIVDFGLATTLRYPDDLLKDYCGTPEYQAPEVHKKLPHRGPPIDVWAMGVLLSGMLYGELPFTGINRQHVAKRVVRGIHQLPPAATEESHRLIKRLLHTEPDARYY